MIRHFFFLLATAVGLLVSGCDSRKPPGAGTTQPTNPANGANMGDFPIGTELMKSILEENDDRLSKMREDLESMRRQLDHLEASSTQKERVDELKRSMTEILDKQESELRKLNQQSEDMRKVLAGEKN